MSFTVQYTTLTLSDASNRYIDMTAVPLYASNVALDTIGGTAQEMTGDFAVDGTRIKWDNSNYGLFGVLQENDKVRVIFDSSSL